MKAIKDTLRASKLAMTLPNNYFPISRTTENTSSVTTLCGFSQLPQLHGGRTHFQSPLNMHVGGTGSSTYPRPPHSTVLQPHVAPRGTNISYPLSPYTIATSTPPSVPLNAGAPIALGGEVLYPNSPHTCTGTTATSLLPTTGASVVSRGNNISYPLSPPLAMSLPPSVPSADASVALGLLCPQPTAMTFTGATGFSSQLPPDITDLAFSDSSLFSPGTSESDVQLTKDTSQTLYQQPSMFSPTASIPAADYHQHIPLSPPTPLSHPALSPPTPLSHPALSPPTPLSHPALSPPTPLSHPALSPTTPLSRPALSPTTPLSHPALSPTTVPSQPQPKPLAKEHMADVCKCLFPLRARWKTIGTFLCIEHNTLAAIKADNEDSAEMLTELIAEWLKKREPPPTGQALADAVQYISPDKAEEIRQFFCNLV